MELQALMLLNLMREAVWVFDIDRHRIYWANQSALEIWHAASLDELRSRDLGKDMSAAVAERLLQYQTDFLTHDAHFDELWTLYPSGKPVSLNVHYCGYCLPDGRMAMLCQGRLAETGTPDALRAVDALLHTPVMISLYRSDGVPLYRNPAARASVRAHDEPLLARFADGVAREVLLNTMAREGEAAMPMQVHTTQGLRWHKVSVRQQLDAFTGQAAVLVSELDVTHLKASEAKALYLSAHDPLTGLANRDYIHQQFDMLRARASGPVHAALILADLDRFKNVNDTFGHITGDALLKQVATRLRQAVRRDDVVARFGGDEFLILLQGGTEDLHRVVRKLDIRIRDLISRIDEINGEVVNIGATLGASFYPEDGDDFDTLLQYADLAMYSAKGKGRNTLACYTPALSEAVQARTFLEQDLRYALAHRQFELFYQPRVDMHTRQVVGAEALVRWRHPRRGLIPPAEFIPVCENTGLIHALGRQVFAMAAFQLAEWLLKGHQLKISVNLSPSEFDHPGLLGDLEQTLKSSACLPQALQLEITESMLMGESTHSLRMLEAIRALGLSIALDDFGTGYSNLAYLLRFPFSVLKIDRAFVQANPSERPLTEAIVTMSRLMQLTTVAEGVETEEQCAWLQQLGVLECQGFLFAPPLPAAEFEALLCAQVSEQAQPQSV